MKSMRRFFSVRRLGLQGRTGALLLMGSLILGGGVAAATGAMSMLGEGPDLKLVSKLHDPQHVKTFQNELNNLVRAGKKEEAFLVAFDRGDVIFETVFNALDGIGANVGTGERFTRVPRADLTGPTQWASHFPPRVSGPNASSCIECHNSPVADGAGLPVADIHRDPFRTGVLRDIIRRNTPHLHGSGAVQRLAEEMTDELREQANAAVRRCGEACNIPVALSAKGIDFGTIVITRGVPIPEEECDGPDAVPFIDVVDCTAGVSADLSGLEGVARDLIVRPFQWKGAIGFVRDFNRDASNQEMGMQSVEIVREERDGDFDGVVNEMRVGDQTSLAIYISAQPRPVTRQELARVGLIPPLSRDENRAIERGERTFAAIGCATCHTPALTIDNPIFSEPSQNEFFRDERFPAGQLARSRALRVETAVTFDLTRDQPDNRIEVDGREVRLGSFERGRRGEAIVRLYSDLKQHDMGPRLAEPIDEIGNGAATFLTEALWGVGGTAPYLHDGRATTLTEAILEHGGEAQASRDAFVRLKTRDKANVIAFLDNLTLLLLEEEEEE